MTDHDGPQDSLLVGDAEPRHCHWCPTFFTSFFLGEVVAQQMLQISVWLIPSYLAPKTEIRCQQHKNKLEPYTIHNSYTWVNQQSRTTPSRSTKLIYWQIVVSCPCPGIVPLKFSSCANLFSVANQEKSEPKFQKSKICSMLVKLKWRLRD